MHTLPYLVTVLCCLFAAIPSRAVQVTEMTLAKSALKVDGDVSVEYWEAPVYTPELLAAKVEGQVILRFIVGADNLVSGVQVRKSSDKRLDELAIKTLGFWRFSAALKQGVPIATDVDLPVIFRLPKQTTTVPTRIPLSPPAHPSKVAIKPAEGIDLPVPDYPAELEAVGIRGVVTFDIELDDKGQPLAPLRVLSASHASFIRPALEMARTRWKFQPAMQGRVPRASHLRVPVEYDFTFVTRLEVLEKNGFSNPAGTPLKEMGALPRLTGWYEPVYPIHLLRQKQAGKAIVEFTVNGQGLVEDCKVIESSAPEFGESLVATVSTWSFDPATKEGRGVSVPFRVSYDFKAPADEDKESPTARLLAAGQVKGAIVSPKEIDGKLSLIYRLPLVMPSSVKVEKGTRADISVIIDREGRVRLPSFSEAKVREFSWAAAIAASQWVFEPPMKDGKPVDVRVAIPFVY